MVPKKMSYTRTPHVKCQSSYTYHLQGMVNVKVCCRRTQTDKQTGQKLYAPGPSMRGIKMYDYKSNVSITVDLNRFPDEEPFIKMEASDNVSYDKCMAVVENCS